MLDPSRRLVCRIDTLLVALSVVAGATAAIAAGAEEGRAAGGQRASSQEASETTAADDQRSDPARAPQVDGTRTLGIVLYRGFELLDVCGPAEMFGNLGKRMKVIMVADQAGPVASTQGLKLVADYGLDDCPPLDLLLVPGGMGTFRQLQNERLLTWLRQRAETAEIVTSVCSGSAILAKAGLLDGRRATSNKQFFGIATSQGPKTEWVKKARWVDDGNRVTSSGVSAGMDMALHIIARLYGAPVAEQLATATEYTWHRDADRDPFAKDVE